MRVPESHICKLPCPAFPKETFCRKARTLPHYRSELANECLPFDEVESANALHVCRYAGLFYANNEAMFSLQLKCDEVVLGHDTRGVTGREEGRENFVLQARICEVCLVDTTCGAKMRL